MSPGADTSPEAINIDETAITIVCMIEFWRYHTVEISWSASILGALLVSSSLDASSVTISLYMRHRLFRRHTEIFLAIL